MRDWINLFEAQEHIDIGLEGGSVEGYVTDNPSIITNWFMHRHDVYEPAIIEMILSEYESVAFLNNVNVEQDERGQGTGTSLLKAFEQQAISHGAQAIILFADINESQEDGFDLEAWYKRHGYEEVHPPEGLLYCPLMILDCR